MRAMLPTPRISPSVLQAASSACCLCAATFVLVACDVGDPVAPPRATCEPEGEPVGTWRPIPDPELGIRGVGLTHAWTGTELLIWGEPSQDDADGNAISAAAYRPESGTWRDVSARGVLEGGAYAGSVWTGTEWIVWGGRLSGDPPEGATHRASAEGARYHPDSDTWVPLAASPLSGRFGVGTVWTGTEMLIWGGVGENGVLGSDEVYGAAYDPEQDTWRVINPADAPRVNLAPIWTGSHMLLWGALSDQVYAAKYDPARDVWSSITAARAPNPSGGALWTGRELLAWAFVATTWARYNGGAYDPQTDSWRSLSMEGAPPSSRDVWTGDRVLTWGDYGGCDLVGIYDPETDRWSRAWGEGAPEPRGEPVLVWTGSSLLVYGGRGDDPEDVFTDGGELAFDAP